MGRAEHGALHRLRAPRRIAVDAECRFSLPAALATGITLRAERPYGVIDGGPGWLVAGSVQPGDDGKDRHARNHKQSDIATPLRTLSGHHVFIFAAAVA